MQHLTDRNYTGYPVYEKLRTYWAIPVHVETLTQSMLYNAMPNHTFWLDPDFIREKRKVARVLYKLHKDGYIRRVRPGVYSAYGPERD